MSHARWAAPPEADVVLWQARAAVSRRETTDRTASAASLRILEGERFLEIAPAQAHKGRTVDRLLERLLWDGALSLYFGDDDKDEEAFSVVRRHGGFD